MGAIVLLARDRFVALASPTACANALDLFAIAIVRQWPELTVGQLFAILQPAAFVLALGVFAQWCFRLTQSVAASASMAAGLGLSPAFAAWMAPPTQAAAIGAVAAAALAVSAASAKSLPSRGRVALALVALMFGELIVPAWFAACAVVACWLMWRTLHASQARPRIGIALGAGAMVGAAPFVMLHTAQVPALSRGVSWYGCALTRPIESWQIQPLAWMLGPVVVALAALGLLAIWRRAGSKRMLGLAGALALASVATPETPAAVALAPLIVAVWSAAAVGTVDLVEMIGNGRRGFIGVALLLCVVPLLEVARVRAYERDDIVGADGHERATLGTLTSILNRVPSGARFVEEDASVHLLLRAALAGGRRASKPFAIIPATRSSVTRALSEGAVFAFPRGQELLSLRGFALREDDNVHVRGVARVDSTRPCATLGSSWTDLGSIGVHGRISIVAADERSYGPVLLYFGGSTDYKPGPENWSPRVRTGFDLALFDTRTAAAADRLREEARAQRLDGQPVFRTPFVSRILLRRTPLSPPDLPIVLGPPPTAGIGRMREDAPAGSLISVCDAPAVTVSRF